MTDTATTQDTPGGFTRGSPWPLVVALGFTLSEVGIILGFRAVAITGLLIFICSLTGILHETGYVTNPERTLTALGVIITSSGLWLLLSARIGTTIRGQALLIAGIVSLIGAIAWRLGARRNQNHPGSNHPSSDDYTAPGGDD